MHVWISNCLLDTHKQQIVYYKVVYGKIVWKLCHIDSGLADFLSRQKTEFAKKSEIFCVSLESVLEIRRSAVVVMKQDLNFLDFRTMTTNSAERQRRRQTFAFSLGQFLLCRRKQSNRRRSSREKNVNVRKPNRRVVSPPLCLCFNLTPATFRLCFVHCKFNWQKILKV